MLADTMVLASILQDSKAIRREETKAVTCSHGTDTDKGWTVPWKELVRCWRTDPSTITWKLLFAIYLVPWAAVPSEVY